MPNPDVFPKSAPATPAPPSPSVGTTAPPVPITAPQQDGGAPDTSEEAVAALRAQLATKEKELAETRARAQQAQERERHASQQANTYQRDALTARQEAALAAKQQNDVQIQAWEAEQRSAKEAFENAFENADKAKLADAQQRMTDASAQLLQLRDRKEQYDAAVTEVQNAPQTQQPQQNPNHVSVSVEQFIQQTQDHRVQKILRAFPGDLEMTNGRLADGRTYTAPKLSDRMMRVHHLAIGNGLDPNSDAYFEFVEDKLGMRQPQQSEFVDDEAADATSQAATTTAAGKPLADATAEYEPIGDENTPVQEPPRRKGPPAAPVSRQAPTGRGPRLSGNARTLTPQQIEAAMFSFGGDKETAIAKYKQQLDEIDREKANGTFRQGRTH